MIDGYRRLFESIKRDPANLMLQMFGTMLTGMSFDEGNFRIEGVGVEMAWVGEKAVRAKGEEWMNDHEIHGATAEGPFVGATGFAVKFVMDVTTKSTGERRTMNEIGVYTVEDGKIVIEEFMYSA